MPSETVDPFDSTDADPIRVVPGEFSADGAETARLGATNARAASSNPLTRWRAASQANRMQWLAALAILAVVGVLLPALISLIGANQRAHLQAAEAAGPITELIELSPEVLAAKDSARSLLGCYGISSAYVPQGPRDEMKSRLEAISDSVIENDAARTSGLVDDAREYFVAEYAPKLADNVETLMGQWTMANWSSDEAVYEAEASLRSNLSADRFDALCADTVALGSALGKVRDEDMAARSTWVPVEEPRPEPTTPAAPETTAPPATTEAPKPTTAPEPTTEPEPTSEPEPTDDPQFTSGPQPDPTPPANGNNGNRGNG